MAPATNFSKFPIFSVFIEWLIKQVHVQIVASPPTQLQQAQIPFTQLQWQGTYPTPHDACGSWSTDCKKSSGNCKMKSQEIQWDWKLDTQLNVFPFPWQLMRGKPRRILCQLWARMGMWLLSWDMGAASYKEEGASLDGIKHIPWLCEAPLGFWLIILVDFSFCFFLFFWSVHWLKRPQTVNSPSA